MLLLLFGQMFAQEVKSYQFAQRDTQALFLDVYMPQQTPTACIVFAFGGGFMTGSRNGKEVVPYLTMLQERGFMVVAFDYRLALKGKKINSLSIKPVENAIMVAVEDLYAAVGYLIDNQHVLNVDTSKVVLIGSSAGAITALQADYMLCRQMPLARALPSDFRFAGVVSFAGAIFSREGALNYLRPPAPTLFLHGTDDKLVPYKKIQLANIGFFGDYYIIKRFKKFGYPFIARRYEGHGHEIAAILTQEIDVTVDFINTMVLRRQPLQIDMYINDPSIVKPSWGTAKPSALHRL